MGKKLFVPLLAAFAIYCLFVLTQYSAGCHDLAQLSDFTGFVLYAIGAKFLFVLVLVMSAYGYGGAVFGRWLPPFDTLLDEGLFKTAAGLLIISYLVFFAGLAGLLYPAAGYAFLAAGLGIGARDIIGFFRRLASLPREVKLTLPGVMLASLVAYILIYGLYGAFQPPIGFDILMYHYGAPRMYIDAHRIFPTPDINGSAYPFGTEMLYTLAMMLESDISANLVNFLFAVGQALVAYAFARRYLNHGPLPLLAAAIFLSLPVVVWLMPQAYVEFSQGFLICASVYALVASFTGPEKGGRWLFLSAAMMGFAMCVKYTSNLVLFIALLGVVYKRAILERAGIWRTLKSVLVYSAIGILLVMPWYIRNMAWYDNPFFPMMATIAGKWTFTEAGQYVKEGMNAGMLNLLAAPWRVTMNPRGYYMSEINSLGPCLLMFIPGILLFFKDIESEVKYLVVFCLLYLLEWFYTAQNLRYIVVIGPFLAICAGYPIGRLLAGRGATERWAGILLTAGFCFTALYSTTAGVNLDAFPSHDAQARERYYEEMADRQGYMASYDVWKWINVNLPKDAVIYQLWDDASVYFRRRNTIGFTSYYGETSRGKLIYIKAHNSFDGFRPGEEIIANLKKMGAQYLLINTNREGHSLPDDAYFVSHVREVLSHNGIYLYEIVY